MKSVLVACCMSLMIAMTAQGSEKSTASAKVVSQKAKTAKIKALVQDFYFQKAKGQLEVKAFKINSALSKFSCHDDELPSKTSCIDAICSKLSEYECNDASDLKEIAVMCANKVDGSCITQVCSKLSDYECNDKSDLVQIAKMCSKQVDGSCVQAVCSKVSEYECNDKSDLEQITGMCAGLHDGSCVTAVCSKLSEYECNDKSDLQRVIDMCKNP